VTLLLVCPDCKKTIPQDNFSLNWDISVNDSLQSIPEQRQRDSAIAGFFQSLNIEVARGIYSCPVCGGMTNLL
jgi:hypothetical protein